MKNKMNSFFSKAELGQMGFKEIGENVLISRKSSIYSPATIKIGNNVRIDDFCILSGNIEIGDYVHISAFVALYGKFGIKICDFCGVSPRSTIFTAVDDFSGLNMIGPMVHESLTNVACGSVLMEDFTQIGASSIVFPGITLKEGSVCGAFSLVKGDLENWTINAGIPSREIKKRNQEVKTLSRRILL